MLVLHKAEEMMKNVSDEISLSLAPNNCWVSDKQRHVFSLKCGNLDRLFQFSISQVYVISAITTFPANCLFLPILAF